MKVAIAGYGIEGRASYDYWKARGDEVTIVDEHPIADEPDGATVIAHDDAFSQLDEYDVVIRTAGLSPHKIKTTAKVWSATNEFFRQCPAPIIGVTGTKGKGTTSSLIASILRAAGKKVHLVGNIGVPALVELPDIQADDIVVYELSSFQLWDLEASPHVAVVLMIEPDHLDVHASLEEYVGAKAHIRRYQQTGDMCFYHPSNQYARQIALSVPDEVAPARRYAIEQDGQVYVKENTFFVQNTAICSVEALQLVGRHNVENACAAISAALVYTTDSAAVEAGLRSFHGLEHRLKLVTTIGGVSYYDDSIATTPGSALAALQALDTPKVLILGGSDKGADFTELVQRCKETETRVITIGAIGPQIAKLCRRYDVDVTELGAATMDDIVATAAKLATPGSSVILSPAAASFDMFTNYADRGDQFIAALGRLA